MSDVHAQTVPFVRKSMLPEAEPPARQRGVPLWLRENLFSGWFNTILTILGAAAAIWLVASILPWMLRGVWNADSLRECRDIVIERYGEGVTGACWAMIRERWPQYIFGMYPQDIFWRPTLAFVLLLVAIAPVLYLSLPRKLLIFSALYPALAYWLLWGGTIWLPVMVLVGFALGWGALRLVLPRFGAIVATAVAVLVPVLWWGLLAGDAAQDLQGLVPLALRPVGSAAFGGFLLSFVLGVTGVSLSLPLGLLLSLGRRSDLPLIHYLCVGFIEFIRGVPLITLLFTASLLLNYFLPPNSDFDIILRVIIMVTLFAAAYIAEVIRGALAALPRGQYEAADALGLDYWKAQRLIILPQALKISIPGIVSTFIGLFKDTTLVVFIGLRDPLKGVTDMIRQTTAWKGIYWEPYIFVGALFFVICFSMSRYAMYLERKLERGH